MFPRGNAIYIPSLFAGGQSRVPLLLDTFSGSGAITAHSPEVPGGTPWLIENGSFSNLTGGKLLAAGNNARAYVDLTPDYNIELYANLYIGSNYTSGLRFGNNGTTYYYLMLDRYNSYLDLYRSSVQKIHYSQAFSATTTYPVTLWRYNNHILAWLGSTLVADYYDNSYYTGTRVGYDSGAWATGSGIDDITVYKAEGWEHFSVIGDSISLITSTFWPALTAYANNGHRTTQYNHAVGGQTILSHMDAQVDATELDPTPGRILIALGTNDNTDVGIQAMVEANLLELHTTFPAAKIYYMNVLPCTSGTAYTSGKLSAIRSAIAAACATYSAFTVCWDTYTDPWIDPAADTSDGLHPTAAGHIKIKDRVMARL